MELPEIKKYSYWCFLHFKRIFLKKLGYLWRLKASELLLALCFKTFCSTRTPWLVRVHIETFAMSQHGSIVPAVQAPNLSGSFLHGRKIQTISIVPCPETCFHLSKPNQEVWTAWGCRKRKKIIAIWIISLSVAKHWPSIWCHTGREHHFCLRELTISIKQTDSFTVFKCSLKWLLQIMIMT